MSEIDQNRVKTEIVNIKMTIDTGKDDIEKSITRTKGIITPYPYFICYSLMKR